MLQRHLRCQIRAGQNVSLLQFLRHLPAKQLTKEASLPRPSESSSISLRVCCCSITGEIIFCRSAYSTACPFIMVYRRAKSLSVYNRARVSPISPAVVDTTLITAPPIAESLLIWFALLSDPSIQQLFL